VVDFLDQDFIRRPASVRHKPRSQEQFLRPRRFAAVHHKPRSSSTPWSTRCTRTSSPATHRGVVIVYVLLRVVHALLLTFSVTSLVVQVIIIQVNGKGNK